MVTPLRKGCTVGKLSAVDDLSNVVVVAAPVELLDEAATDMEVVVVVVVVVDLVTLAGVAAKSSSHGGRGLAVVGPPNPPPNPPSPPSPDPPPRWVFLTGSHV